MSGYNDVDPDADTQYAYSTYGEYEDYPYSPASAPTAIVTTRSDSSSVIALAILAAAVMICAAIVVVVVITDTRDTDTSTPASTTVIKSTVTAAPEPSSPVRTHTPPPTSVVARPPVHDTPAPTPTVPVISSLQRLQTQAALDTGSGLNAGSLWVPQLSSKRPGTVDDGIVWDYDDIWQEHLQLRQQYGAILLWSADWDFNADDLWVTVATMGYPTADGARQWCRDHGRDTWHCFPTQLRD